MSKKIKVPDGAKLVFRATRVCPKTGKTLHAKNYGLKAWPILIQDK